MSRRRPSIAWCAVGFGAAGMGVGSFIGLWFGVQQERLAKRVVQSQAERDVVDRVSFMFAYAGVHTGLLLGLLAGAFAGIAHALFRRHRTADPADDTSGG